MQEDRIEKIRLLEAHLESSRAEGLEARYERLSQIHLLMVYLTQGKSERELNDKEACRELDRYAMMFIEEGTRFINESNNQVHRVKIAKQLKEAYQVMGRRDFEKFLIAIEWNFPMEMRFYDIRKNVLYDWAKELEKLEYGTYKGLSISAPPRTGKALSMDSGVLTVDGWKKMRDIEEGDQVIGADGKPAEVLGVFPQGIKEMYRVVFDDDTEVKCSGDHMWTVQTNSDRQVYKGKTKERVVKTTDMLEDIRLKDGEYKYSIKYVKPVEFRDVLTEEDLHPYLVGIMLSNGSISENVLGLYTPYIDILNKVEQILPKTDKLSIKKYNEVYKCSIGKKKKGREKNTTMLKFMEYKLTGHTSKNKFIPKKYLYSSIENRLELLRGLMDGDGSSSCKQTRYTTVSKQLAEDIVELIRSLGGRVTCNKYKSYKNGKRVSDRYDLQISIDINPFYCEYKTSKFMYKNRRKVKKIVLIEQIPDEECQCILVNHPEHLFVTDGYNLTHNTAIGTMFFMWCMLRHADRSCFFTSHTSAVASKVYNDIVNMLEDGKREITSIFPNGYIVQKNAEQNFIRLKSDSSNPYHTAYFRGIDGNMARSIRGIVVVIL